MIGVEEKLQIEKIFALGYQKAVGSLSRFINQNVNLNNISINTSSINTPFFHEKAFIGRTTILHTKIMGLLAGSSYFILNENEKDLIANTCLSKFKYAPSLDTSAVLLEIDNIISAAVITELANAFGIYIYGHVPEILNIGNINEFNHRYFIENEYDIFIIANGNFIFEDHINISPYFIWKIDKDLLKYCAPRIKTS